MTSPGSPRPSALDRAAFVDRFGGIFEHSPWVAEQAYDRGLGPAQDSAEGLHAVMAAVMRAAPYETRLALLRAHPDLAGRLALSGGLTASSTAEQASAGLDRCTPAEYARLKQLNEAYVARFGFPFIMAVRGSSRADILAAFETRVTNAPDDEFETALAQVERITLLRLKDMLG